MRRHQDGTIGLMGHVIADYPSAKDVRAMIAAMADAGVEVIEIQIPFSEPMADGPVFLAANHDALRQGVGYGQSLALMREMAAAHRGIAFVFMSYLNVLYKRGFERFAAEAKAAGARGVIVPDLPLEHAAALDRALSAEGLVNVRLVPPNASDERIAALCEQAQGLIYAVARRGVTGAKTEFGDEVAELAQRIRACSALPVAVGFGVKTGADVRALRGHADYAVVGTQSLQKFREGGLAAFKALWSELAAAAR
jgi:tryptophan synthase alpha chain